MDVHRTLIALSCAALLAGCGSTEPSFDTLTVTTASMTPGVVGVAYTGQVEAAGGDGSYTWAVASGALPAGLTLSGSSGQITGTPTGTGTADFTVQVDSGDGQTHSRSLSISVYDALAVTTTSLPAGTEGAGYDQTVAAVGGDGSYAWSVLSGTLPPGIALDAGTGQLSGVPTVGGDWGFTLRAVSGDGQTIDVSLTLTVISALTVTTAELPNGVQSEAYSESVIAAGGDGTFTWSIAADTLPSGLSLNTSTGEVSGTPTTLGSATFTLQVDSGDGQTVQAVFTISVFTALTITTGSLPNAVQGIAYQETVAATGGDGSYTWSVATGALPAGLSLGASSGTIAGTPTDEESAAFTLRVESGDGQALLAGFAIDVELLVLLPTELCSDNPPTAIGTFADGILQIAVRQALGIPGSTNLTCDLLGTLTVLNANGIGITDLEGMQNLTGLVEAELIDNSITDLTPLSGMTSLEKLNIARNAALSDLSPLAGLTSLVDLIAGYASITDVSALSGLTGLRYLYLRSNDISDISALSGMTRMWHLDVAENTISDITVLSAMVDLEILAIADNSITDLGPLSGLTRLENFIAGGNGLSDVSALSGLTAMRWLTLSQNPSLSDVSALSGMTELVGLHLSQTSVSDVTPLSGLTNLGQLWLEGTDVTSLSPLSGLTSLSFLSAGWSVTDISGLEGLTSLSDVRLSVNNSLSDIQSLIDNPGLGSGDTAFLLATNVPCAQVFALEAKGVAVTTECLTPYELCNGDGNAIATFEDATVESAVRSGLGMNATDVIRCQTLWGLGTLDVAAAGVTSLAGLQNATGLTQLDASANNLSDVSWLLQLSALQNLYLQQNSITDITSLEVLTSLTDLRLDDNAGLADIQPLINNTGLAAGDSVNLTGTAASCPDVEALRAEGVTVISPCPP